MITPTTKLKLFSLFCVSALGILLISGMKVEKEAIEVSQDSRPNIVFMIADDWSYPACWNLWR